jgi:hypothetical protein
MKTIRTNHCAYTAEQCRETGFRDGRDGTRFYPCNVWKLNDGDRLRGDIIDCAEAYAEGYRAGRTFWAVFWGSVPSNGYTRFDEAILADIETFRQLGRV